MPCKLDSAIQNMLFRPLGLFFSLIVLWLYATPSIAAEQFVNADILDFYATHANPRMRFRTIDSQFQDKGAVLAPFMQPLAAFSDEEYQELVPKVLEATIPQLQALVNSGELSYESLTLFYLRRIQRFETDPELALNAVIALNPNVLLEARAMDRKREQNGGVDVFSIAGMPVLLKDNIGATPMATTAGAAALQQNFSDDAFITGQLKAAGALILGKANLSEWAYFFCGRCPLGYSAVGGQTLNPYGRGVIETGGSSSGSAVVAAANFAAVTVGTETSGSILSPASSNSLVGFKPTTGSLSRTGIVPVSGSLDTPGPITRSVVDAVILFNAMAGYDQQDLAMGLPGQDRTLQIKHSENSLEGTSLEGIKVGQLATLMMDFNYKQTMKMLESAGAELVDIDSIGIDTSEFGALLGEEMRRDLAVYLATQASEQVSVASVSDVVKFNELDRTRYAPYGQSEFDDMARREAGEGMSQIELDKLSQRLQGLAKQQLDALFDTDSLDVLAFLNNYYAGLAALANYPAITIPLGLDVSGAPVGLTLISPPFSEQSLVDVAVIVEALTMARVIPLKYHQ